MVTEAQKHNLGTMGIAESTTRSVPLKMDLICVLGPKCKTKSNPRRKSKTRHKTQEIKGRTAKFKL